MLFGKFFYYFKIYSTKLMPDPQQWNRSGSQTKSFQISNTNERYILYVQLRSMKMNVVFSTFISIL